MKKIIFIISILAMLSACEPVCYIVINTDKKTNVEETKAQNTQTITIKKKGI